MIATIPIGLDRRGYHYHPMSEGAPLTRIDAAHACSGTGRRAPGPTHRAVTSELTSTAGAAAFETLSLPSEYAGRNMKERRDRGLGNVCGHLAARPRTVFALVSRDALDGSGPVRSRDVDAITLIAELYPGTRLHSVRDQTYCRTPPTSRLLGVFRRFSAVTSAAARKDPFPPPAPLHRRARRPAGPRSGSERHVPAHARERRTPRPWT